MCGRWRSWRATTWSWALDLTTVVSLKLRGFATIVLPAAMNDRTLVTEATAPALSDEDFLAAFLAARLGRADFDHRGHLRAAWLLLQRHPVADAVEAACAGIHRLAIALGATDKYHRTRTEALVRLMAHAGAAAHGPGFEAFLRSEPELVADARGLLARHYSPARLDAPEARERFLAPDRLPLPA